jgi:hypothetical protein
MSSVTWARTLSMCAPIARRSIATTLRWRLTKRAQQNANFTTSSSDFGSINVGSSYWTLPPETFGPSPHALGTKQRLRSSATDQRDGGRHRHPIRRNLSAAAQFRQKPLLEKAQSRISFSALETFTGDYRGSLRTRITRRGRERYPAKLSSNRAIGRK